MDGIATQCGMVRQATGGGGGGGLIVADSYSTAAFGTSHTASGVNLGDPSPDRLVIVCFACRDEQLLSATIAGVSATIHGNQLASNTSPRMNTAVFSAVVPTGSTGDIVVNFSGSSGDWLEMQIFSVGAAHSHVTTQTANGDSILAVTMPSSPGGFRVAAFASILGGTPTIIWEGMDNQGYRKTIVQNDSFAYAWADADLGGTVSIEEIGTSHLRTTLCVSQFEPS